MKADEDLPRVYIHAGLEGNGSKVAIDGTTGKFSWAAGDEVAVYASKWYTSDPLEEAGPGADFAFAGLADANRQYFAVYPAASAGDVTASSLTVSFPASYTLPAGNSEEIAAVMVAKNAPGEDLSFRHVGAIIRLTVKDVPQGTKFLHVDFPDKVVTGDFAVAGLDSDPFVPTVSATAGSSRVSFTLPVALTGVGSIVLNIPVPAGEMGRIKVTAADASGNIFTNPLTISGPTLARAHGKKLEMYLPSFSISATEKVIFAPGNLQASTTDYGASWTWHFAEHQYDYIGNAAANTSINGKGTVSVASGTVDLFGWSTSGTAWGIWNNNTSTNYTGDLLSWATLPIGSYPANFWRLPECDAADDATHFRDDDDLGELQYLIHKRAASTVNGTENARFIKCKLENGTYGLLLFPDHYDHPTSQELKEINVATLKYQSDHNVISMADWELMESAGCVFLPYAGQRTNTAPVFGANGHGEYWTGTPSATATNHANCLYVSSDFFRVYGTDPRCWGSAVRLVRSIGAYSASGSGSAQVLSGDTFVVNGRESDRTFLASDYAGFDVSVDSGKDWIVLVPNESYTDYTTTVHVAQNDTGSSREAGITFTGAGQTRTVTVRQLAMHPVMGSTVPGSYGACGIDMLYREGGDQWSWRAGASAGSFRLLDEEHVKVLVLGNIPNSVSLGDSFDAQMLVLDGFDTPVNTAVELTVVDAEDNTFWLSDTSATGLIIKKNTL